MTKLQVFDEGARRERLLRLLPSFLASCGFAARRLRVLPSLNLKKKGDCSQSNFSRLHCLAIPKRVEHKEKQTKSRKMTRRPRSHVRILKHRTWANVGHCSQRMNIAEGKKKNTQNMVFVAIV